MTVDAPEQQEVVTNFLNSALVPLKCTFFWNLMQNDITFIML